MKKFSYLRPATFLGTSMTQCSVDYRKEYCLHNKILVDLPNHAARKNMVEKLLSDRSVPDIDYASIADRL
jgi:SpoVK/Ycf46/Vps4 family AAA+-type ATPase